MPVRNNFLWIVAAMNIVGGVLGLLIATLIHSTNYSIFTAMYAGSQFAAIAIVGELKSRYKIKRRHQHIDSSTS
jgi:hypothetical protein